MSLLASYRAGLLFTLLAVVSPSQDYRGRIQGTVRDTSDAVIAGASVTLHNVNTGISTLRKTNETGHYIFDLVEPGSYSVTIENPGFTKFVQGTVPLGARGDMTVDATLKTGDTRETSQSRPRQARFSSLRASWKRPSIRSLRSSCLNFTAARSCWRRWIPLC